MIIQKLKKLAEVPFGGSGQRARGQVGQVGGERREGTNPGLSQPVVAAKTRGSPQLAKALDSIVVGAEAVPRGKEYLVISLGAPELTSCASASANRRWTANPAGLE